MDMLEVALDTYSAMHAAEVLSRQPGFAFLDSTGQHGELGRYSFIGVDPFGTFRVRGGVAFWNGERLAASPLQGLRAALARYSIEADSVFPFRGGAIGYIAYDFGRQLETLAEPAGPASPVDEISFDFYDVILAFDHQEGRARLFSSGFPAAEGQRAERARHRADNVMDLLNRGHSPSGKAIAEARLEWHSNFTPQTYAAAVKRVKDYILAGDIYQANIAQRFTSALPESFDAWAFYRSLRAANPAPFGAFLRTGGVTIASSSPERFVACRQRSVEARPIKGTARREADPVRDAKVASDLLASEKDRAENTMIVDLLRNDLSRVCAPGTVDVPVLCGLETYEGLHHLTSVVTGYLRDGRDVIDLIAAGFPGGSITGAPKLRAMDIITEIEGCARGIYCGSIGYLGFDGDMDLNIAIRTVTLEPGRASFAVGGGVTLLSDPVDEHAETLVKAGRIFTAFQRFTGGEDT